VPEFVLQILYGAESGYLDLSLAVRLLVAAALLGYTADVIASFLHGVSAVRLAFITTAWGALATVVLAIPLIGAFGLIGNCLTHVGANGVRLIASQVVLARMLGPKRMLPGVTVALKASSPGLDRKRVFPRGLLKRGS
jgi:O-antigen/teichoic acid export membrane protein